MDAFEVKNGLEQDPVLQVQKVLDQKEKQQEQLKARERLAKEAQSLRDKASRATGQLMQEIAKHPSSQKSARLREYEAVQANASSILSALSNPNSSLEPLKALQASSQADFSLWLTSSNKKKEDEDEEEKLNNSLIKKMVAEENLKEDEIRNKDINTHPLMNKLAANSQAMDNFLSQNESLRAQTEHIAFAGEADLRSTVDLAGKYYDARENNTALDLDKFVADQKTQMFEAAEGNISEQEINSRIAKILEKARYLDDGMRDGGQQEASQRLLTVSRSFIIEPMDKEMAQTKLHFVEASEHLQARAKAHMGHHAIQHLDDFNNVAAGVTELQNRTSAENNMLIRTASENAIGGSDVPGNNGKSIYGNLMHKMGVERVINNAENYAQTETRLMEQQAAIYEGIKQKTLAKERMLKNALSGNSVNIKKDMDEVAASLGNDYSAGRVQHNIIDFRMAHDMHIGQDLFLANTFEALKTLSSLGLQRTH